MRPKVASRYGVPLLGPIRVALVSFIPAGRLRKTPLSLALDRAGSVLAVKGPLRRFAPLTAPVRSEGMTVYEGKGGSGSHSYFVSHLIAFDSTALLQKAEHSGRVDGPKGNLSGIPGRAEPIRYFLSHCERKTMADAVR